MHFGTLLAIDFPAAAIQINRTSTRLAHILDLLAEDDRLNVYAGELEVRPPGAPTTRVSAACREELPAARR
jgi:hypothetical protein